jgi:hypothetical protein
VDWEPKFHSADGDGDEDLSDYAGVGEYGLGDPLASPSALPLSHGPGYQALEQEWLRDDENTVPCVAGVPSSGYPAVSENILDAAGCTLFGNCRSLAEHSDYTRYGGTPRHTPSGTNERLGVFFLSMAREDRQASSASGGAVTEYRYMINVWVLVDAGSKELEGEELEEYISEKTGESTNPSDEDIASARSCRNWVQPLLLEEGSEDRLRYIAMAYSTLGAGGKGLPFWSAFFDQLSAPYRIYAYAQSQVYNKLSEDMFTQDWRARLEQSSLLESALSGGSAFELGSPDSGSIGGAVIDPVNNH